MRDVILHYRASVSYIGFNQPFSPLSKESADKHYRKVEPETGKRYQLTSLTAPGAGTRGHPQYNFLGVSRFWRYNEDKMNALLKQGRIIQTGPGRVPRFKRYLDDSRGVAIGDSWSDISPVQSQSNERVGYPTQKPLALIRRIIIASSAEGDFILDPFCGCATACIAAELEHRQWVGIDISAKAADLVKDRMEREVRLFYQGAHRTDIPTRTDLGKIIRYSDEKNRRWLYGEQGGYCHGCEEHFLPRNMTVDHIIPRAKGGTDHISNLQLLCGACNSIKGTKSHAELLVGASKNSFPRSQLGRILAT